MAANFRGSTIRFSATCKAGGGFVTPDTVQIYFNYSVDGQATRVDYEMIDNGGGVFAYDWDSSVADAGPVKWKVRAVRGTTAAVSGGSVQLVEVPGL